MTVGNGSGLLRVTPFGGLGEIGLNCLLLEYGDAAIAIDCGLMFPELHMLGIDLVIPDLGYVQRSGIGSLGFVMTHGHEDHIGALRTCCGPPRPISRSPMAGGLIAEKLREHGLSGNPVSISSSPALGHGAFAIEAIHMTHSIVDAVALAITTPVGTLIHSGDFKIDQTPIDDVPSDLQRLAEYGARGVLLLLSDSTNAEHEGYTPSGALGVRQLGSDLQRDPRRHLFFRRSPRTSTALHRCWNCRSGMAVGSSPSAQFERQHQIATQLGYLQFPPSLFADIDELGSCSRTMSRYSPRAVRANRCRH